MTGLHAKDSWQLQTAHSTKGGFQNFDSNSIQSSLKTLFPPGYPRESREGYTGTKSMKTVYDKKSASKQQDFVKS
jgi:hypothetical protein